MFSIKLNDSELTTKFIFPYFDNLFFPLNPVNVINFFLFFIIFFKYLIIFFYLLLSEIIITKSPESE